MELGADVLVECVATPRLEASRPIVLQGLALDSWSLERKSAFFKLAQFFELAQELRWTWGFVDKDVETFAVDAGIY